VDVLDNGLSAGVLMVDDRRAWVVVVVRWRRVGG
jgi:hypothetical protein